MIDYAGGAEAAGQNRNGESARQGYALKFSARGVQIVELTRPYRPLSRSLAMIVIIGLPGGAVSDTVDVYVGLPKEGALSFASVIAIVTVAVDDSF